jgi:D-alanyl-lipoteichoic acid acyltransferase DltB (MBOAT superfamily)
MAFGSPKTIKLLLLLGCSNHLDLSLSLSPTPPSGPISNAGHFVQQVEVSNRIWKIPLKEFFFQRLCKSITRAIQCHDKKNLKKQIKENFQHPHHLLAV